jgi:hypothetical protein
MERFVEMKLSADIVLRFASIPSSFSEFTFLLGLRGNGERHYHARISHSL